MKKNNYLFLIFLTILFSCSSDDSNQIDESTPITVSTSDFNVIIDEGLPDGTTIGTITGNTNQGDITFSILSQNPNNSFSINSETGLMSVENSDNFDYEINPQISGVVKVSNGDIFENSNVTINLNDIQEANIFTGDITLNTQQQVEDFGAEFYTEVTGYIDITGPNITSLTPLNTITKVGSIFIRVNPILSNLDGLHNLTQINNDLTVVFCDLLTNIDQLNNITSLNGDLRVFGNNNLVSLNGLLNITDVGNRFRIGSNDILTSLEGLNNLQSVGGNFEIENNPLLNDISSLSNLTFIGGDMQIFGSGSFTSLSGLSNLNTVGGNINIRNTILSNLNGLDNLNTINGYRIEISNNQSLLSLEGLGNNISFGSTTASIPTTWITLENNNSLQEIDALENISSFYSPPMIEIWNNSSLTNLDGLVSLSSSIAIHINGNINLTNLDGLINLVSILGNGNLEVVNNTSLYDLCGITALIQNNGIEGNYIISGNTYNPSEQDILDGNCQN